MKIWTTATSVDGRGAHKYSCSSNYSRQRTASCSKQNAIKIISVRLSLGVALHDVCTLQTWYTQKFGTWLSRTLVLFRDQKKRNSAAWCTWRTVSFAMYERRNFTKIPDLSWRIRARLSFRHETRNPQRPGSLPLTPRFVSMSNTNTSHSFSHFVESPQQRVDWQKMGTGVTLQGKN